MAQCASQVQARGLSLSGVRGTQRPTARAWSHPSMRQSGRPSRPDWASRSCRDTGSVWITVKPNSLCRMPGDFRLSGQGSLFTRPASTFHRPRTPSWILCAPTRRLWCRIIWAARRVACAAPPARQMVLRAMRMRVLSESILRELTAATIAAGCGIGPVRRSAPGAAIAATHHLENSLQLSRQQV